MNTRGVAFAGVALFCSAFIGAVDRGCAQETRRQPQEQNSQQSQYRDQAQNSSESQAQQNVRSFRGKVSQKENSFFLEELVHRTPYRLADTWEIKRFVGKKVRVTGWLDQDQKTLHVKSMSLAP
jgi:type III secretory pathway component EscR